MNDESVRCYYPVESGSMKWFFDRLSKCKFCDSECPVPVKKRNYGCRLRPLAYMKECPTLRAYNKRNKL